MAACDRVDAQFFSNMIQSGCMPENLDCPLVPIGLTSVVGDTNVNAAAEVLAGLSTVISLNPARAIDAKKIVVSSSVARFFVITDIQVSAQSILPSQQRPIPAEMLSEVALDAMLRARGIPPNNQAFALMVTNIDPLMAHRFLAGLWGVTLSGR